MSASVPQAPHNARSADAQRLHSNAKQHKRANKAMRKLRTYIGRTVRDIRRKTADDEGFLWTVHQRLQPFRYAKPFRGTRRRGI